MIHEIILATRRADGRAHLAPMGLRETGEGLLLLAPFRPSATLENLQRERHAVVNYTDDVRVFAGCLTGRRDWPVCPAGAGFRLESALAHTELEVVYVEEDPVRPRFHCRAIFEATHAPFRGFNRAQAAVLEGAVLVSRLHLLPAEQVEREFAYLQNAVEKTAGPRERVAWEWLLEALESCRASRRAVGA